MINHEDIHLDPAKIAMEEFAIFKWKVGIL